MRILFIFLFISHFFIPDAFGQVDRSGPSFGIGIGLGYSKHADSYSAVQETIFNTVKEYSGFRILSTDLKIGWGLTPRAQVFYTLKYALPNTTISPYRSFYQGILFNYSFSSLEKLIYGGGIGINKAGDKNGKISRGTLANISLGYEFNPNFLMELNTLFGEMKNSPHPNTFLDSSREFSMILTFNYLFYKSSPTAVPEN